MFKLKNSVRHYAWGDPGFIPELLGIPNPEGRPFAELWMGAHPDLPSEVPTEEGPLRLDALIAKDPDSLLGAAAARRFGPRLPFLFKVLSAARPLSIQAHPNKAQAEEGFRRENGQGIPLGSPERLYKDDNHKPEILCALTEFEALCGFRPLAELRAEFSRPELGALRPFLSGFERREDAHEAVKALLESLLTLPVEALSSVLAAFAGYQGGDPRVRWFLELSREYPGDRGALAPLYLNYIRLRPGEALFQPAGDLHAYLRGSGMELMANSDNVLRGGCTPKQVAVEELLKVLTFHSGSREPLHPQTLGPCEREFRSPAAEFRLSILEPARGRCSLAAESAEILFCASGAVQVAGTELARGEALFVPADAGAYRVSGEGVVYRARVPR